MKLRNPVLTILAALGLALVAAPAANAAECHILPGGTIGEAEPEPVPDRAGSPTDEGPGARGPNPTVNGLPARVDLRSDSMGQNRNYYFALKAGRLYVKPNYERTGRKGAWRHVPAPDCLEGDIRSIDVDDDELTAINSGNQIFGMDQALDPVALQLDLPVGVPLLDGRGIHHPRRHQGLGLDRHLAPGVAVLGGPGR